MSDSEAEATSGEDTDDQSYSPSSSHEPVRKRRKQTRKVGYPTLPVCCVTCWAEGSQESFQEGSQEGSQEGDSEGNRPCVGPIGQSFRDPQTVQQAKLQIQSS